jgi:hypothetical protein
VSRAKKKHIDATYREHEPGGYWSARCGAWSYERLEVKEFEKLPRREQCLNCRRLEYVIEQGVARPWRMPDVVCTREEPDGRGSDACFFLTSLRDVDPFSIVESGPKGRAHFFPDYHLSPEVRCDQAMLAIGSRERHLARPDYTFELGFELIAVVLPRYTYKEVEVHGLKVDWWALDEALDQ